MRTTRRSLQFVFAVLLPILLSACGSGDSSDEPVASSPDEPVASDNGILIKFTNPADVRMIRTPNIGVSISGTVISEEDIEIVTWKNDRGGTGTARFFLSRGQESWATGNVVLQLGANNITITAKDVTGRSVSESLRVKRENTISTGISGSSPEPGVIYSYQSDLSHAAPVVRASIFPQLIFLSVVPSDNWTEQGIARIKYLCCKGQAGPGAGDSYGPVQTVVGEPWKLPVDLTGLEAGGTRRIEIWAEFTGGTESNHRVFDFTISSNPFSTNNAPVITGSPYTIAAAGNQYSLRPTAQDADGDTMRFTIQNKPAWALFDEITGRLFGIPTSNDIGTYSSIVIRVSDGTTTSGLPAFSITIEAFGNGSTTLTWIAPTERIDNTPLTNLAGFNVYYGQASGDYGNKIALNNPGIATYVVDNLSFGTWYFVVTANDTNGLESNPSGEGRRTF